MYARIFIKSRMGITKFNYIKNKFGGRFSTANLFVRFNGRHLLNISNRYSRGRPGFIAAVAEEKAVSVYINNVLSTVTAH